LYFFLGISVLLDAKRHSSSRTTSTGAAQQATSILGPTVEILNNEGYSYMLRGDYKRARAKLHAAQRKDPQNKYVANNLKLLNESWHKGKGID
jgi:Flp pilus assembly protein TadD